MALSRRERREQKRKLLKDERLRQLQSADETEAPVGSSKYNPFLNVLDKHYKKILIFPILLFLVSLVIIGAKLGTTGELFEKDVSLKGGAVVTIPVEQQVDTSMLQALLHEKFPSDSIEVRSATELGVQQSVIITTSNTEAGDQIIGAVSSIISNAQETASSETTGPTLGNSFFIQTAFAMLIAFALMAIVVFISFRTFTPSVAVVICVFADIVETIAAVNLFGIPVSAAGIAAFLMLIGYSVDTDILLTTRVLKSKEGSVFDRTVNAMKTGLLMTATALAAVIVSLLFTHSEVIKEIMIIILFGLIFDIINTWLQNTALLRWYLERKDARALAAGTAPVQRDEDDDIAGIEDDELDDEELAEEDEEPAKQATTEGKA